MCEGCLEELRSEAQQRLQAHFSKDRKISKNNVFFLREQKEPTYKIFIFLMFYFQMVPRGP